MVDSIGKGSGAMAREAIRAALDAQARAAERLRSAALGGGQAAGPAEGAPGGESDFAAKLADGVRAVDREIARAESLPQDFVAGKVEDFHEIAVQLKKADIGFRFAMEVRNKLIDAYREVMRMSV